MDLFQGIGEGFRVAFQLNNVLFALIGCLAGTLIGVLPGIGPMTGVALLIPLSYGLDPTSALIMMAGVYYGAMYGGSTTSILLNVPGESSSVMTCLDGYPLAQKGRAGPALAVAAIGSFWAGTLAVVGLMFVGPWIAKVALMFGPSEYFALMFFALTAVAGFSGEGSAVKSLIAMVFGLMLSTVGEDLQSGVARFTFGNAELLDGIEFLIVALGLFAVAEVIASMQEEEVVGLEALKKIGRVMPTWQDLKDSFGAMNRGGLIGFLMGSLPGGGATVSSFLAYDIEKRVSKHPEKFGKGAIEGVAAPESANNAAAIGALTHLLTLGIPGSGTTAIMLGAFIMFGIRPGPLLFRDHPAVVWGLIASMYLGNIILLILNLPLVGVFARITLLPKKILLPMILAFSALGVYTINSSIQDLLIMAAFGAIGYFMRKREFPLPPVVLALVLGGLMEQAMRQAMTISDGNPAVFVTRPISAALLALGLISLFFPVIRRLWAARKAAVQAG